MLFHQHYSSIASLCNVCLIAWAFPQLEVGVMCDPHVLLRKAVAALAPMYGHTLTTSDGTTQLQMAIWYYGIMDGWNLSEIAAKGGGRSISDRGLPG